MDRFTRKMPAEVARELLLLLKKQFPDTTFRIVDVADSTTIAFQAPQMADAAAKVELFCTSYMLGRVHGKYNTKKILTDLPVYDLGYEVGKKIREAIVGSN